MIDLPDFDFPKHITDLCDKLSIPGNCQGFAIWRDGEIKDRWRRSIACGMTDNGPVFVERPRFDSNLRRCRAITDELFKELCQAIPAEVKRSGRIFQEDILDGINYFIRWREGDGNTRLMISNPDSMDNDDIVRVVSQLSDLLSCGGRSLRFRRYFLPLRAWDWIAWPFERHA